MTSFVLLAAAALAGELQVVPLWEGRANHEESFIGPNDTERRIRNVTMPVITVYRPVRANGTGVIVAPGGGFRHLAIDKEGNDVATWLNSLGVTAFVLKYSAGVEGDRTAVLKKCVDDSKRAMRIVTDRAAEWKIDPKKLGFMGFSAGGVLAAEIAMRPEAGFRPAFVIPIYAAPPASIEVTAEAPPAFFAAANDDGLTATGTVPLYAAWTKAKRPATVHVFANGGHGFGIRKTGKASDTWTDRLTEWLRLEKLID